MRHSQFYARGNKINKRGKIVNFQSENFRYGKMASSSTTEPELLKENDVFVGNLSLDATEDGLRKHFCQFGQVEEVRILYHFKTKRSRRYGFVSFADKASVKAAMKADNHIVDGKRLEVKNALFKTTVQTNKNFDPLPVFKQFRNRSS